MSLTQKELGKRPHDIERLWLNDLELYHVGSTRGSTFGDLWAMQNENGGIGYGGIGYGRLNQSLSRLHYTFIEAYSSSQTETTCLNVSDAGILTSSATSVSPQMYSDPYS